MSTQQDDLQKLWREEKAEAKEAQGQADVPPADPVRGKAEAERLRRRIRFDGWLKMGALIFLGAAFPLFAGPFSVAAWGVLGFSLLATALGIFQVAWTASWRERSAALPLATSLTADLELWRRRRPALAVMLGATPALAWQVYQLAYLALNPGSSGRMVNLLFLTAGGPMLWLLASWRQWARLEAWLLQIEQALSAFDEETAANYALARRRSGRRSALIAALMLLLLLAGTILFLIA